MGEQEILKMIEQLTKEQQEMTQKIESKVDFKTFAWILGVLMTVVLGILGIIYAEVKSTNGKVDNTNLNLSITNSEVSQIKGILTGAEIIK